MKRKSSIPLVLAIVVLLALAGGVQRALVFPYWKDNYNPNTQGDLSELSGEQLLVALAGFREMIAGILWVQGDRFFDEGNYDAILPIIRLVTILDPKQIDVYATGMWHIGYNFTDSESRSDRRYLPSAVALGKEGIRNNPDTYELFFETGWLWYHKIQDNHEEAVGYWEDAVQKEDIQDIPARKNLLAQAYQRAGDVNASLAYMQELLEDAEERFADDDGDFSNRTNRDTIENNLDTLLVRMAQRGWFAREGGYYEEGDYDTKPPFDVGFSVRLTVESPRVIRAEGTWNVLPVGTRIRFILRDEEYPDAIPGGMVWDSDDDDVELDPPSDVTFMQEQLFVRDQRFNKVVDMSLDPTMYPFLAEDYVAEFYYDPRLAPDHIQDKFGWNGVGMTDDNFLRDDIRPGRPVIFATLELTKDQIERRGEWSMGGRTPIVETENYIAPSEAQSGSQIIDVPGILSQEEETEPEATPAEPES
jgi:hypothetical protein